MIPFDNNIANLTLQLDREFNIGLTTASAELSEDTSMGTPVERFSQALKTGIEQAGYYPLSETQVEEIARILYKANPELQGWDVEDYQNDWVKQGYKVQARRIMQFLMDSEKS